MSLEDRILLVTNASLHEVAVAFLQNISPSEHLVEKREIGLGLVVDFEGWAFSINPVDERTQEFVQDRLGLVPILDMTIFLDKTRYTRLRTTIFAAILSLLSDKSCDCVLLYGFSETVFLRKGDATLLKGGFCTQQYETLLKAGNIAYQTIEELPLL